MHATRAWTGARAARTSASLAAMEASMAVRRSATVAVAMIS